MKDKTKPKQQYRAVRLTAEQADQLKLLADADHRSLEAYVRLVMAKHLASRIDETCNNIWSFPVLMKVDPENGLSYGLINGCRVEASTLNELLGIEGITLKHVRRPEYTLYLMGPDSVLRMYLPAACFSNAEANTPCPVETAFKQALGDDAPKFVDCGPATEVTK